MAREWIVECAQRSAVERRGMWIVAAAGGRDRNPLDFSLKSYDHKVSENNYDNKSYDQMVTRNSQKYSHVLAAGGGGDRTLVDFSKFSEIL